MTFHLFGVGDPVNVHVAFKADGKIAGVFAHGERAKAEALSELAVETWTVSAPELGPTTWARARAQEAPDRTG